MAIDGTYKVAGSAKGVDIEGTIEVHTEGDTLAGTAHLMGMDIPLEEGKVNGDDFSCSVTAPTALGKLKFKVNGSVKGDAVEGSLKHLLVKAPFSGTRIEA